MMSSIRGILPLRYMRIQIKTTIPFACRAHCMNTMTARVSALNLLLLMMFPLRKHDYVRASVVYGDNENSFLPANVV